MDLSMILVNNFLKINLGSNARSEIQILTGLYLAYVEHIDKCLVNTYKLYDFQPTYVQANGKWQMEFVLWRT